MLKVNLGNMRSKAWASNTEVPVSEPTAGYATLVWSSEKTRLTGSPPISPCPYHSTPNNIWMCWPIFALNCKIIQVGWVQLQVSKGKLILTMLNHKIIQIGWGLKRSSGSTGEVSMGKCSFYKFQKNLPLTYTHTHSLCFVSADWPTKTHTPVLT